MLGFAVSDNNTRWSSFNSTLTLLWRRHGSTEQVSSGASGTALHSRPGSAKSQCRQHKFNFVYIDYRKSYFCTSRHSCYILHIEWSSACLWVMRGEWTTALPTRMKVTSKRWHCCSHTEFPSWWQEKQIYRYNCSELLLFTTCKCKQSFQLPAY